MRYCTLAVDCTVGQVPGVDIYKLMTDGSLKGYWQSLDDAKEGNEVLTPVQ